MLRKLLLGTAAITLLMASSAAVAGNYGTADEARAMLTKAVAALKADKAKALAAFNAGTDGFKDRDLYVFCAGADGIFTAHPKIKGKQIRDLKDKTGNALGIAIMKAAKEGSVDTVSYLWPRPGSDKPVPKVTFVTKVADQTCGVGHYKK
jgi:signal transduction histidine kinase